MSRFDSPILTLNDDHTMPQLGLGVYKADGEELEQAIHTAIETGYRLIDTAAFYGNEEGVGRAIASAPVPRDDLFVATKVWNDDHGYDNTKRAVESSLTRLGLDRVDLYLIHWPMPQQGLFVETWKALIDLREQGLATSIGVCNFPPARVDELIALTDVTPAVNQVELHPYFQQEELRADNTARGIVTQAWSPLSRAGSLFETDTITSVASAHDATPAQVVLAWHRQIGNVAIPKSVTPSRIVENWESLGVELTQEDIERIAHLDRGADGRTGMEPETMKKRGE